MKALALGLGLLMPGLVWAAGGSLSLGGLVELVIYLIVVGGVLWLLLWLVDYVGIPEPFAKVAKIIIMVVAVFLLINVLLGFVGEPLVRWR